MQKLIIPEFNEKVFKKVDYDFSVPESIFSKDPFDFEEDKKVAVSY